MKKTVITTLPSLRLCLQVLWPLKVPMNRAGTQDHGEIPACRLCRKIMPSVPKKRRQREIGRARSFKHKPKATTLTFRCAAPKVVDTHRLNQAEGRLEAMRSDGHIDVYIFLLGSSCSIKFIFINQNKIHTIRTSIGKQCAIPKTN